MIYKATKLVEAMFKEKELKHSVREVGSLSFVQAGFSGDNTTFTLRFISSDDDNDVKIMTEDFAKFPEDKRAKGYELINELNRKYKYMKLTLDPSDGGVCAQYDLPVRLSDSEVGKVCFEIAIRFSNIVDDIYPDIMKAIWA